MKIGVLLAFTMTIIVTSCRKKTETIDITYKTNQPTKEFLFGSNGRTFESTHLYAWLYTYGPGNLTASLTKFTDTAYLAQRIKFNSDGSYECSAGISQLLHIPAREMLEADEPDSMGLVYISHYGSNYAPISLSRLHNPQANPPELLELFALLNDDTTSTYFRLRFKPLN